MNRACKEFIVVGENFPARLQRMSALNLCYLTKT